MCNPFAGLSNLGVVSLVKLILYFDLCIQMPYIIVSNIGREFLFYNESVSFSGREDMRIVYI